MFLNVTSILSSSSSFSSHHPNHSLPTPNPSTPQQKTQLSELFLLANTQNSDKKD
jgi:hypothetical protein